MDLLSKFLSKKIKLNVFLFSSFSFFGFLPKQLSGGREQQGKDVKFKSSGTNTFCSAGP